MKEATMSTRWMPVVGRLIAVAYFVMTSVYCLLDFMPFTYVQLLESELVPALVWFERTHAWMFLPVVALADYSLGPLEPRTIMSALRTGFRVVMGIAGVLLLVSPVLPGLENALSSFVWSQVALVPLVWLAVIDLSAARRRLHWSTTDTAGEGRLLVAAVGAAGFTWLLSTAVALSRPGLTVALSARELGVGSVWSLTAHVLLFLGACTLMLIVRGLAALTSKPSRGEAVACGMGIALVIAFVFQRTVFAALSFSTPFADAAAVSLAVTLVLSGAALAARARVDSREPIEDGFAFALSSLVPFPERSFALGLAWIGGFGVAVWIVMNRLAPVDWNYLLQRLMMIVVWLVGFAACHALARPRAHTLRGITVSALVPLCALGAFLGIEPIGGRSLGGSAEEQTVARTVDTYGGYNVSAGLLAEWLRPGRTTTETDVELYAYLQAYTGIPASVALTPREVSFVPDTSVAAAARPNIFIIVVDSLRSDYLGAYNPEVAFTPAIDRFASDSLVFTHTFSRYGATGLSEPSIWVGGMLPHKQYVSPFAPMNALQTLLKAQGYQGFISVDAILDKILEPEGWVTALDQGRLSAQIELCGSLGELQEHLSARAAHSPPVFAYTLPQDIHIATIARGGVTAIDEGPYDDFYSPYASRLRRLDSCFGSFIDYLQVEGLYDDSIVILTSDHGDSLGEGGRFGRTAVYPRPVACLRPPSPAPEVARKRPCRPIRVLLSPSGLSQ